MRKKEITILRFCELQKHIQISIAMHFQSRKINDEWNSHAIRTAERIGLNIETVGLTGLTGSFNTSAAQTDGNIRVAFGAGDDRFRSLPFQNGLTDDDYLADLLTIFHDMIKKEFDESLKIENIMKMLNESSYEFFANGTLFV